MANNLRDLFKFKKSAEIIDPETKEVLAKFWVRILGDEDIKEAYKYGRIASANKRASLKNKESDDYKDAQAQLEGAPRENLIFIMKASREAMFANEAGVIVVREELPKLEEIAAIPDAPTLEEQEILDRLEKQVNDDYAKKLQEYVDDKLVVLSGELDAMSDEELIAVSQDELVNIQALEAFAFELQDQKSFRGTYEDEGCKVRAFRDIDDFRNAHSLVKIQINEAINSLDTIGPDELKN